MHFYDVVERGADVLTQEEGQQAEDASNRFLLHYQWLAKQAMREGQLLWSVTPQLHFFAHLSLLAKYENPRVFWAYSAEDFVCG